MEIANTTGIPAESNSTQTQSLNLTPSPAMMPYESSEFEERVAQRASDIVAKQQSANQLLTEYSQKYPELLPFQDAIVNEALLAMVEAHHNGQMMDDRTAIEAGIQQFQTKIKGYIEKYNQLQTQDGYRKKLMKLDVGFSNNPVLPSVAQALNVIGDSDQLFSEYRQAYLRSKNS